MVLTISHDQYRELNNKQIELTRYEDSRGVVKILASMAGGVPSWYDSITQWGEHEEIQFCPQCGESHSKHSPAFGCFGCSMGLK